MGADGYDFGEWPNRTTAGSGESKANERHPFGLKATEHETNGLNRSRFR